METGGSQRNANKAFDANNDLGNELFVKVRWLLMFALSVLSAWAQKNKGNRLHWKTDNGISYHGRDLTLVGPGTARLGTVLGRFSAPVYVARSLSASSCKAHGLCDGLHNCTEQCRKRMKDHSAKEFVCTTCGDEYVLLRPFEYHVLTCGEKNEQCPDCPATFKQKSDLVRHLRTHTHEKPFKCNECPRTFAQPSGLSVHLRTHGTEADCNRCHLCDSTYKYPSGLSRHVRSAHRL
jgi:uncharacterized C2H2 Zn-finger protein